MFISWNKVFHPTPEQRKQAIKCLNFAIQFDLDEQGAGCSNCKHRKYVQQNQFYDYLTCEFDETIKLPYGRNDKRRCCGEYEFVGFMEEE